MLFPSFPSLNVSPSFLAPEAIDLSFEGQATAVLPSMTGVVTSPEPYQMVRVAIHCLRSQAFADLWKQQMETSTILGSCTVRPDAVTLSPYIFGNMSITGVERLSFAGRDPGFVVNIMGNYQLNAACGRNTTFFSSFTGA